MKKDTKDLEEYLEAHADELIDTQDDARLIRHAKEDIRARKARATNLQKLRRDKLKISQSQLAQAVGANVRTLQSWETGRQDYPKAVEILMTLMNRMPSIKRELLSEGSRPKARPPVMKRRGPGSAVKPARATKKHV
jgi:DNA-binding transcriptional regulator YiaG